MWAALAVRFRRSDMPKHLLLFVLLLVFVGAAKAQLNLSQSEAATLIDQGKEMLLSRKYSAARAHFDRLLFRYPNSASNRQVSYLQAYAALKAGDQDGLRLANAYFDKYGTVPESSGLSEELALYYFEQGDYKEASRYFSISSNHTSDESVIFKRGYTAYQQNQHESALRDFSQISDGFSQYAYSAAYYAGYIAYNNEQYIEAREYLEKAERSDLYTSKTRILLASIYYQSGNSDKLIALTEDINARDPNAAPVYLLAGEVQHSSKNYAEAIEYFEKGKKSTKGNQLSLKYKIGYAYYQIGNMDKAIDNFKEVALSKTTMGHQAAYYLGEAYVAQGNLAYASSAFYNASRIEFDRDLQASALFQFGKVSYQQGQFKEAVDALMEFSSTYSDHPDRSEAEELVSKALLNTNDYDLAINYIEQLDQRSSSINATYQRVTLSKGAQLFNKSQFYEAIQFFNKSIGVPEDKELIDEAYYWKGEAYSIGKKYDDALSAYRSVFNNSTRTIFDTKALYASGYALYNQRQYQPSIKYFNDYLNKEGQAAINASTFIDARLRLADGYYATKQYDQAITHYSRVANSQFALRDYARYQLAMSLWLDDRVNEANIQLNRFFKDYSQSTYADDAYFLKAQISFETGSYNEAIAGYSELIATFPQSNLLPYALVRRAISNSNLGSAQNAENDYKLVLTDYPRHPMAENAILGLQEVMSNTGKSEEFGDFLSEYKQQNPESTNLESVEFESAKSLYFSQSYEEASSRLRDFIETHPSSSYIDEAQYYLGDSYYRNGNLNESLNVFRILMENPSNNYYRRSVGRGALIQFTLSDYQAAVDNYRLLLQGARSGREQNDGIKGLMESHFALANHDSTIYYANKLVDQEKIGFGVESLAYLYLGKSAQALGENQTAIDHYLNVLNLAKDENGAEAQYNIALIQFKQKDHRQSIQSLYNLNSNFSSYEGWLGESFLLIAENFIALEELFQAEATLNSVLDKSPSEGIRQRARERLATLEDLEKKLISDTTQLSQDSIK